MYVTYKVHIATNYLVQLTKCFNKYRKLKFSNIIIAIFYSYYSIVN